MEDDVTKITVLGRLSQSLEVKLRENFNERFSIAVFTGHMAHDFKLFERFNLLTDKSKSFSQPVEAEMTLIIQQYFIPMDVMDVGHRFIIGLHFNGEVPEILLEMKELEHWDDWDSNQDWLYLGKN